ncbi:DUF6461 domain-containing protein [Lentzea sp. NPDC051213]|uniref:DUF6461 domain-containing protein n=1 Tax=Lentzea sp. NPDC051213 TaxID=3364126 RepID=UPI0037BBA826
MLRLSVLDRLANEPVRSPSGLYALHYDSDGVAVLTNTTTGERRWRAGPPDQPAAGSLVLTRARQLEVWRGGDRVVWKSGIGAPWAFSLGVTDDGDFELYDHAGKRLFNSRTGPGDGVPIMDEAPVGEITGDRYLARSGRKHRLVSRTADGGLRVEVRSLRGGSVEVLPPALARWMEQDGTVLTWRVRPGVRLGDRLTLCLVRVDGSVAWCDEKSLVWTEQPAVWHRPGGHELVAGGRLRHQSLSSPSGAYTFKHERDGDLVLRETATGVVVWRTGTGWAGDGCVELGQDGDLVLRNNCGAPVWRSETTGSGRLILDDDGRLSLLGKNERVLWTAGAAEGRAAPAVDVARGATMRHGQLLSHGSLTSPDGGTVLSHEADGRLVLFGSDGRPIWSGQDSVSHSEFAPDGAVPGITNVSVLADELVVAAGEVRLSSRGEVLWRNGRLARGEDRASWITGLALESFCLTVVHDVAPDEALRRLGVPAADVATGTWRQLLERAELDEAEPGDLVVAAFALGAHTLLVEDMSKVGVESPRLSAGTFAVSYCSQAGGETVLVVFRGGEIAEKHQHTSAGDGVALFCRTGGISPSGSDVAADARIAVVLP